MARRLLLVDFRWAALVTTSLACSSILGIDESERRVAAGGANTGAAAGSRQEGNGGRPDAASGTAGQGGAVSRNGGAGGAAGNPDERSLAGAGASAGATDGSGEPGATLDQPCSELHAVACATGNAQLVLRCDAEGWVDHAFCHAEQRCDPGAPGCRQLASGCHEHGGSFCFGESQLTECSADQFEQYPRRCPFGCSNGACLRGSGTQLIVHPDDPDHFAEPWPASTEGHPSEIPVCFASEANGEMARWIRDELETTWGRYPYLEFIGFESCAEDATGVVIEFPSDCQGRLGSGVPLGYPGEGNVRRVGICRTYIDANGTTQDMDQTLTRFMARHQLGHVLGLPDQEDLLRESTMLRGIEYPSAALPPLSAEDLNRHAFGAFRKHSAALVTPRGRCLRASDAVVLPSPCANEETQWWVLIRDRVVALLEDLACVAASQAGAGPVELTPEACDAADARWTMRHAQWSTPGHCVVPALPSAIVGSPLATEPCGPVGATSQSWSFEVLNSTASGYVARIHWADPSADLCVTLPEAQWGAVPVLEPCGTRADQRLHLSVSGEISAGSYCLQWDAPDSHLHLGVCGFDTWLVSGALESSTGLALSVNPDDPAGALTATPLVGLPNDAQIFDWYF